MPDKAIKALIKSAFSIVEAATLNSAREVGGDLYDFLRKGSRLYFIIGDASGKGVPAALFSFVAGTVFRMSCRMDLNPGEIIERINEALVRNNATSMFVTVFVGVLDLGTGELSYGCAGHNPPVIIPPDGQARLLHFAEGCAEASVSDTAVGLLKAVDEFVDGAEQSDDIAILAIGL